MLKVAIAFTACRTRCDSVMQPQTPGLFMSPPRLIFPRGVRLARTDEVPAYAHADVARGAQANITPGFVLHPGKPPAFDVFAEANVDAPMLWEVFDALVRALLPSVAAALIGFKDDEEPHKAHYSERDLALAEFFPYRDALANDGFLTFGMIFQHEGATEEVFVEPAKCLKIWSSRPHVIREVFAGFGIPELSELSFLDEFPRVTEQIPFEDVSPGYVRVHDALQAAFATLPER